MRTLALLPLLFAAPGFAQSAPTAKLDDDHIEPAWFGGMRDWHADEEDAFDYFWVKPGFSFRGRKIEIVREPVKMLGSARRETGEVRLAGKISDGLLAAFSQCVGKRWKATAVESGGDYILTCRVVDAMTPAGFGFMRFGQVAWDVKIAERGGGEIVFAAHNNTGTGRDAYGSALEGVDEFCEATADPVAAWKAHPHSAEQLKAMKDDEEDKSGGKKK